MEMLPTDLVQYLATFILCPEDFVASYRELSSLLTCNQKNNAILSSTVLAIYRRNTRQYSGSRRLSPRHFYELHSSWSDGLSNISIFMREQLSCQKCAMETTLESMVVSAINNHSCVVYADFMRKRNLDIQQRNCNKHNALWIGVITRPRYHART